MLQVLKPFRYPLGPNHTVCIFIENGNFPVIVNVEIFATVLHCLKVIRSHVDPTFQTYMSSLKSIKPNFTLSFGELLLPQPVGRSTQPVARSSQRVAVTFVYYTRRRQKSAEFVNSFHAADSLSLVDSTPKISIVGYCCYVLRATAVVTHTT